MSARHRPYRVLRRIAIVLVGLLVLALLSIYVVAYMAFNTEGVTMGAAQKSTTSKDGTVIAYEQSGSGPVVVLVAAALADRGGTARLAKHLSEHFTVINYDRRGRGKSGDTQPYAPSREVDDIEALIDVNGGLAFLFGSSSGAALALDAASQLGPKVKKVFLYEPPFIVDGSHPPVPADLGTRIHGLVAADRRNDAVKLFFTEGMGIPSFGVTLMRFLMPGWSKMRAMAQTIPYDLAVVDGTQTGKALPKQRWVTNTTPTLVMVGSKSEAFFHSGAKSLTGILPHAEYRQLEGGNHGSVLLSAGALANEIEQFFQQ